MIKVAVTQRVAVIPDYGERRDCLDQSWSRFLFACGLTPLFVPNIPEVAVDLLCEAGVAGLLLTGGNDLVSLGGDAPERDVTENALLDVAEAKGLAVLGVCRGMQLLQERCGVPLMPTKGHVVGSQVININGQRRQVNSYHRFGAVELRGPLEAWGTADDGVIKAIHHVKLPITGIMWHPERMDPFSILDIELFRTTFRMK
jgi:N5-(cytidine 5'-diphosphoramidyl)-L-glutamine hydrolase